MPGRFAHEVRRGETMRILLEMSAVWATPVTPRVAEVERVEERDSLCKSIFSRWTCYSRERV